MCISVGVVFWGGAVRLSVIQILICVSLSFRSRAATSLIFLILELRSSSRVSHLGGSFIRSHPLVYIVQVSCGFLRSDLSALRGIFLCTYSPTFAVSHMLYT